MCRMFAVTRCGRCHAGISANELVMRARDLVYHLHCFSCTSCGILLSKGDHFGMRDRLIYCRPHYEVLDFCDPGDSMDVMFGSGGSPGYYPSSTPPQGCKGRPRKKKIVDDGPPCGEIPVSMRMAAATLEMLQQGELSSSMESLGYDSSVTSPASSNGHQNQRTKRMRTSFKHHQLRTMKTYFAINQNPDAKDLKQLAQKTGLSKRVLQGRTATQKHTASPEFNERLKIVDLFPPLCQRMKIEIRFGDTMKKKVISVKYINLKSISNDKDEGFLPTFGPIWLHMYSNNKLEGYVGSILMSMQTEIEDLLIPDSKRTTLIENIVPLNETKYFHNQGITIFCCIFDITAINKKYSGKPISFRITCAEIVAQYKPLPSGEDVLINESPARKPNNIRKNYYCIPLLEEKPCLWLTTEVNFKKSVYNNNILSRMVIGLRTRLTEVEGLFNNFHVKLLSNEIDMKLQDSIDYVLTTGKMYIDIVSAYRVDYNTNLDMERRRLCIREMIDIIRRVETVYDKFSKKKTFRKLQKYCNRIEVLIEDIQDSIPDIFFWVVSGKKKLAFERIPIRDIISSQVLEENGQFCGRKRTLCFYGNVKEQKNLMMKVNVFFVAYLDRHEKDFLNKIPSGYKFQEDIEYFPPSLVADTQYVFQLRAYIFQGRIISGFDKSGLADPLVRIIIKNRVKDTQVIYGCLNPIWDETLVFDDIVLYGSKSYIKSNPPTILLEVFDQDELCKTEFVGRAIIVPDVVLDGDEYNSPKLKWHKILLKDDVPAEILAAFEYIELTEERQLVELELTRKKTMSIPKGIKPELVAHKMEVLFWGVRNLRKVNLMYISRPRMTVLCGDHILNSDTIENASKCSNFSNQSKSLSFILPLQEDYAPPLRFKIFDSRRFGVYVFAGVHITPISPFLMYPISKEERKRKLAGLGYKSNDSLASRSSSALKIQLKDIDVMSVSDIQDVDIPAKKTCFLMRIFGNCFKSKHGKLGKSVSSLGTYELLSQDITDDEEDYDWWTKYYASIEVGYDESITRRIQKLKVYGSELENQPEFKGFSDILTSFDLYKGKKTGDETLDEENITATFKGSVKIYRLPNNESDYVTESGIPLDHGVFHDFPENSPLRCFEMDAMFPQDHTLKIAVWDYDYASADDLIGETEIDLEIRYYTRHRAHCGIAETYETSGYCAWRDQHKPSVLLSDLCKRWNTDPPEYGDISVDVGFKKFAPVAFTRSGDPNHDREVLALSALRRWKEMPVVGLELVPEHVETRSLYHPSKPGVEQGKLQLWIDIFPVIDLPPPKKVEITPRVPGRYELRVIIWNTEEVVWLIDSSEAQYTDVHYRSLTGEGNFNWRFVFPFEYLPTENKVILRKKESLFAMDETEFKLPCKLTLQVWDNDTFSKDDFLEASKEAVGLGRHEPQALPVPK
ncbi:unnamed protein product [Phaedon cochleariae]|uniref:Uncharacterized protein n=1 Tax=Phaedon cochleariae TaxID=80249 RepID=A0A9P0DPN2_PHACE|nr:unnamed protein product [Phaedon cochleariae]